MEQMVDQTEKIRRYREMGRVLSNMFLNVHNDGIDSDFRARVGKDLECWNVEEEKPITLADLEEFIFQVGGCIFSPQRERKQRTNNEKHS